MATQRPTRRIPPENSAVFICDIQDKFRNAIWEFDKVVLTSQKVLRAAQALQVPIFVTTQNRGRLGETVPELNSLLESAGPLVKVNADKTLFSMWVPSIAEHTHFAEGTGPHSVAIVGIETHICVTQTALDLRAKGYKVYILADGVSSCNREEVPIALARLRAEGCIVTTSESWMYETMGDAGIVEFKSIVGLVKETGKDTKVALQGLLSAKM